MTLDATTLIAATGCKGTGADELAALLDAAMNAFDISTPMRQAHFLAQTAFESALYSDVEENLNYSAQRLVQVFPRYFFLPPDPPNGRENASVYDRRKDAIANVIYANRMGNGNGASGDGWAYRGRGFIQLTGRTNYTLLNAACPQIPCISVPDALCATEYAALSAAWFWQTRGCNDAADANDTVRVTKLINGGLNGLADRTILTSRAIAALGATP